MESYISFEDDTLGLPPSTMVCIGEVIAPIICAPTGAPRVDKTSTGPQGPFAYVSLEVEARTPEQMDPTSESFGDKHLVHVAYNEQRFAVLDNSHCDIGIYLATKAVAYYPASPVHDDNMVYCHVNMTCPPLLHGRLQLSDTVVHIQLYTQRRRVPYIGFTMSLFSRIRLGHPSLPSSLDELFHPATPTNYLNPHSPPPNGRLQELISRLFQVARPPSVLNETLSQIFNIVLCRLELEDTPEFSQCEFEVIYSYFPLIN